MRKWKEEGKSGKVKVGRWKLESESEKVKVGKWNWECGKLWKESQLLWLTWVKCENGGALPMIRYISSFYGEVFSGIRSQNTNWMRGSVKLRKFKCESGNVGNWESVKVKVWERESPTWDLLMGLANVKSFHVRLSSHSLSLFSLFFVFFFNVLTWQH